MSFFDEDVEVIPLIKCVDGNYELCEEAADWLREQKVPLGVLACAGKYRTGKSFLMNRLCDLPPEKGFGVGETVQACTKGIWMYKKLLVANDMHYIAIDTEGIDALDADNTHDVRIFTLALLLSNIFIYNSVGPIDETSLSTLSLMTNICSCVRVNSGQDATIGELSEYFPHFIWVLRDFTLKLVDKNGMTITQETYLENALNQTGNTDERCAIRTSIKDAFKTRTLYTLPRPSSEDHIQNLERRQNFLSNKFLNGLRDLKSMISTRMTPHKMNGVSISGPMYVKLCEHMIKGISDPHGVPVIKDAWSLMVEAKTREIQDECIEEMRAFIMKTSENICTPDTMKIELKAEERRIREKYRQSVVSPSPESVNSLGEQLTALTKDALQRAHAEIDGKLRAMIDTIDDKIFSAPHSLHDIVSAQYKAFAESCQEDTDMLNLWKGVAFDRLMNRWLPHMTNTNAKSVIDLQTELSDTQSKLASCQSREANLVKERVAAIEHAKEQNKLELLKMEENVKMSLEDLDRERTHVSELQERLLQAELKVSNQPVEVENTNDKELALQQTIEALEAERDAIVVIRDQLLSNLTEKGEEIKELAEIRTSLLSQINTMKAEEDKQVRKWEQSLAEMKETNDAALNQIRIRSDKKILDANRERDEALSKIKVLADKELEQEKELSILKVKFDETKVASSEFLRQAKESDMRGRALVEDLQERILIMHKSTLEDMRMRDKKMRDDHERHTHDLLEFQKQVTELEHVRSENSNLKKRIQTTEDDSRELKKMKLSHLDAEKNIARLETEVKEIRARKDEAVKEREQLRIQMMENDRKLAVANRELQLEKVRMKS